MGAYIDAKIPPLKSPYLVNYVDDVSFTIGAEATNAITVNCQFKDVNGDDLAIRVGVQAYIASDATGDTIAAAASGGIAGGTDGALLQLVTGRVFFAVSEADGDLDVVITDSTARTVYLVIVLPDGRLKVSSAITFTT